MADTAVAARALTRNEKRLLEIIRQKSFLRGQFKLASGAVSDYYLDMKPTSFDAEGAALIGEIICGMLAQDADADAIGGLELGAVPIVAAVCARSWPEHPIRGFVVRKQFGMDVGDPGFVCGGGGCLEYIAGGQDGF